jgi:chromosome segregation ATPase
VAILAAVLFVATLGTSIVAVQQNATAGRWRQDDRSEVARNLLLSAHNHLLSTNLASANGSIRSADASIASLDSQVSKLNGRIGSLNTQLSAQAKAKEKALDENAVLSQLTSEAGVVSNELSTCVDDMDSLLSEIGNDLSYNVYDPDLQSNADTASQVCSTAQADNDQLQSILSGAG